MHDGARDFWQPNVNSSVHPRRLAAWTGADNSWKWQHRDGAGPIADDRYRTPTENGLAPRAHRHRRSR